MAHVLKNRSLLLCLIAMVNQQAFPDNSIESFQIKFTEAKGKSLAAMQQALSRLQEAARNAMPNVCVPYLEVTYPINEATKRSQVDVFVSCDANAASYAATAGLVGFAVNEVTLQGDLRTYKELLLQRKLPILDMQAAAQDWNKAVKNMNADLHRLGLPTLDPSLTQADWKAQVNHWNYQAGKYNYLWKKQATISLARRSMPWRLGCFMVPALFVYNQEINSIGKSSAPEQKAADGVQVNPDKEMVAGDIENMDKK